MTQPQIDAPTQNKPLRLWPGVVLVTLQWVAWLIVPALFPEVVAFGLMGGAALGLAVVVWWAFFSRAPGAERWGAVALMVVALAVTSRLLHPSLATAGMGLLFLFYAIPFLSLAFVAWAVAGRHLADRPRRWTMVATIVLASGAWTLIRTAGITADVDSDFAWRWSPTPEERLLAEVGTEPAAVPTPAAPTLTAATAFANSQAEWPGFRGPQRDGRLTGLPIATDWQASPPTEVWRRPIGPAWSSFAVHGDRLYTQEQRGEHELVAAYRASDGHPLWQHRDPTRFWESNAGAGPRGTPTLAGDRVYALGATGILNALGAVDGTLIWSRDAASELGVAVPTWGFSSSPLVVDDLVIVALRGALAAFDLATGEPRWTGSDTGDSYSSPHLLTFDGVAQVLMLGSAGAVSVAPATGELLWEHRSGDGTRIVQPAATVDGDLLLSRGGTTGLRRLAVALGPEGWTVEERWSSNGLKPYFSDFVVHEGHAYGVDGRHLACVDLTDGERRWKGGRYGSGQLVLLAGQGLLLVVSEGGELALVGARPDGFEELARMPAIDGKTWNHPVLVGDLLVLRNSQEMAAFRLPRQGA